MPAEERAWRETFSRLRSHLGVGNRPAATGLETGQCGKSPESKLCYAKEQWPSRHMRSLLLPASSEANFGGLRAGSKNNLGQGFKGASWKALEGRQAFNHGSHH